MLRMGRLLLAAIALSIMASQPADAQSLGDRLKRKVKQRIDQRTDQAMDKAVDKAEEGVKCAATDQQCIDNAKSEGKQVILTDEGGADTNTSAKASLENAPAGGAKAPTAKPGEGAWANYDFKPGERVLVFEDFSKDEVGDFPRRFEFKSGNIEIVEWQGQRWLKSGNRGEFYILLPETLPERFTLEFDLAGNGNAMEVHFVEPGDNRGQNLEFGEHFGGVKRNGIDAVGEFAAGVKTSEEVVKIRVMADGPYVKVYANEKRIANVPNANLGRSKKIYVMLNGWSEEEPRMIGNIRIAAGGKKLYDALTEKGRVATQGIFFDTNSDVIRPESTPTLKEIGTMLKEHADLKLTIEGHTDNVGNPAANQTLSEKRAAAVKEYLVSSYGIDAARLQTKGFGASKPAASNDTPEGRQQNRRVELVKM